MSKQIILHLGTPVEHNTALYERLAAQFTMIRPSVEERQREAFKTALKEHRWGDFHALMRPFWNNGGEMGNWDEELIVLLPRTVRVFASAGAGYDWVDTKALTEKGIVYCNGATASTEAVADTAIYHIISVFRNLNWSAMAARSCDADQWRDAHANTQRTAWNPQGHVLGIIGLGNIGYRIAQKAYRGLDMKIHYHDLFRKSREAETAVEAVYHATKEELVAVADCVLLATPFSGEALVDAALLARFKTGGRLVNIARGGLVDEDALVDAIHSGQLLGAGLDVQATEPFVNPKLAALKSVALTSHTAGGAMETLIGFERLAMENVQRVLGGESPLTAVNGLSR
ncbi:hypothetical protein ASPZODRAFT_154432 [Penicilliopsis zonata CBS 506.65]|uniref:D-isomer specific 2-hydroxyacid dehydrogenase NAD-binding domain-containing protein n=1 Tax=Penicilliopsis zonata CBS 506.65 TaxID=1073090 RepID=A0A1L9S8R4_9EURO|nr:hypothetical protein ASPZODRAFT_154432 [Penicilliopsis zonata CBS 506.65]OJJ43551.1 hypothetical protein ASPZODRAFT_154432 [Penicilliopsis zonata CBS 506.65]